MSAEDSKAVADTQARLNTQKNRWLMLLSVAMAGGGIALVVLGLQRDWGFLAVFWSGVLAFIGCGWVVGLLKGGGVAQAGCPHCDAPMSFVHIQTSRTQKCESCGEWSTGIQAMHALDPNHVAREAVFPAPLPEGDVVWPSDAAGVQHCPVCRQVSTRSIKLEASSALGSAFAALSPISVQRVHGLKVPACAEHSDGIALDMGDDDKSLVLLFRSWPYYQDFLTANGQPPPQA